ncbi:hypothetical protein GDO86_006019 [Hymenochirus boettgeri]|uniref:Podocalyxin n=1 Tax=Hymenochirus boettgeri TaxID=247094 RepID=A0A8T2J8K5_9PIPI|nr:hypothetical protein GDO86_006019 [Hymenochirus boettgeri]
MAKSNNLLLRVLCVLGCSILSLQQDTTTTVTTSALTTTTLAPSTTLQSETKGTSSATSISASTSSQAIGSTTVKKFSQTTAKGSSTRATTTSTTIPATTATTTVATTTSTSAKLPSTLNDKTTEHLSTTTVSSTQLPLSTKVTSTTINAVPSQGKSESPHESSSTANTKLFSSPQATSTLAQPRRTAGFQSTTKESPLVSTPTVSVSSSSTRTLSNDARSDNSTESATVTLQTIATSKASFLSDLPKAATELIANTTGPIKVTCQKKNKNISDIKLKVKVPGICNQEQDVDVHKNDHLNLVCKAVNPGFETSKDMCKIVVGYNEDWRDFVEILDAAMEIKSTPEDLYEKLKNKKDQDGQAIFSYFGKEQIDGEDWLSMPLIITIVCLAVSLLIIAAIYGCWHQRQTRKHEQRLTEELQTMENGYHDNPTLEVMETVPEMQEKKGGLNGELGDSWIVPLDNLREDLEEEEDTHL